MGVPMPHVADYYAQRAGAGLIISEGTQPSFAGQGYARTPGIHTPEQVAAWKRVTAGVHAKGAKMFMQFMHCGRIAHPLNRQIPDAPVAPSAVKPAGQMWTDQMQMQDFPAPRGLETAELAGVIAEFVTAARNAIEAGFDGVELHAANGYLLNQFLASNSNQRTDAYGGSVGGRIRFVVETVEAVASAIGAVRTGIRVSPGHMFNDLVDAKPLETHVALLKALPTADMAYVHVMLPDAFSPQLNNAGDPQAVIPTLRPHVKGALIAAGNLTAASAQGMLDSGLIQLAVFGRPFISNPDLVERFKSDAPLAQARAELFYTPGPEGYSDYPTL
jgi:N-ethylmaleimide reductase